MAPRPQRPQGDPIFSKPYEPAQLPKEPTAYPQTAEPERPLTGSSRRKQPQVAALLGGLKRARG